MRRRIHFHVFTLLVILGGIVAIPMPTSAIQETQPGQTINVELILDVSGSMAQVIETGETRMDAAKRVIQEVIATIPEQEGINVGLRIYGFGGDNTDEGRAESCQSSELVAPISGVDKEQLLAEIQALQPTGWTPLALSLERAGEDFQSGENVTNAAVLITDGLETCDGDPCSVASALNASDIQLITHVVGFALVPEEQATLGCIAEGGGGQLLGASNASELSTALFDILEELEVVQGTEFIGGTALGILPEGEVGELSVVAIGPYDGNLLPIVVRNNTGSDIIRITAVATAMNPAGQVIASGNDQTFNPNLVRSGGLAFGYAYFDGISLPPDTTFEVNLGSTLATDDEFENRRDLQVVEASTLEGRVVGTLSNIYDVELTGPFSTNAVCFDEASTLLNFLQSYSSTDSVAPNETLSFQVDNFQTGTCPLFLVAASGWDDTFGPNNSVEPPGAPIVTEGQTEAPEPAPTVEGTPASEAPAVQSTPILGDSGCADLASAESILLSLQAAGLPIGDYVVYTAENDPNTLLGRPGQYIAKANFVDTALGSGSSLFDIAEGGSIEVFETTELAQGRADYITGIIAANPILVEYDFINGPVLLRVSGVLTPDQAAVYDQALQTITGC
jgi:hypothetical protein